MSGTLVYNIGGCYITDLSYKYTDNNGSSPVIKASTSDTSGNPAASKYSSETGALSEEVLYFNPPPSGPSGNLNETGNIKNSNGATLSYLYNTNFNNITYFNNSKLSSTNDLCMNTTISTTAWTAAVGNEESSANNAITFQLCTSDSSAATIYFQVDGSTVSITAPEMGNDVSGTSAGGKTNTTFTSSPDSAINEFIFTFGGIAIAQPGSGGNAGEYGATWLLQKTAQGSDSKTYYVSYLIGTGDIPDYGSDYGASNMANVSSNQNGANYPNYFDYNYYWFINYTPGYGVNAPWVIMTIGSGDYVVPKPIS